MTYLRFVRNSGVEGARSRGCSVWLGLVPLAHNCASQNVIGPITGAPASCDARFLDLAQGTLLNVQASGMSDDPRHLADEDGMETVPLDGTPAAGAASQGRRSSAEWAQAHPAAFNGSPAAPNGQTLNPAAGGVAHDESMRQLLSRTS